MRLEDVDERKVPKFLLDRLQEKGIEELNPPQEQALDKGVLEDRSMIVSSPTASGKTLIATLGMGHTLKEGGKAIYLVPLKALASEKYNDYKELFEGSDYRVSMSVGDRDSSGKGLSSKDLIIMTVEKLDSILRHNPTWIKDVDMVVVDEIHLLNSESRGPTLEVTLTRLRELMNFQLLGLSATISNSGELADWLEAELVESNYRPVKLKKGIYWQDSVSFYPGDIEDPSELEDSSQKQSQDNSGMEFRTGSDLLDDNQPAETDELPIQNKHSRSTLNLLDDTFSREHQAIMFVRSRKSAESEAEKSTEVAEDFLEREEEKELKDLADRVKNVLGSPTEQCKRLANCVRKGTAFHHAGLVSQQRALIEDAFRDGLIKSISATPTLAAGVSLPAFRIIIRDVKRYTNSGLDYIPTLEYEQMSGRAGRPEHHSEGQAIAVAKNQGMKEEILERYIMGQSEKIWSKLAVEPVLRMHTLSLIATGFVTDMEQLESFFSKTFYAHQYGDLSELNEKLKGVVKKLADYGFLEEDNGFDATKLGERIAELYIDPYSAHHMLQAIEQNRGSIPDLGLLQTISETVEMKPLLRVKEDEVSDLEEVLEESRESILTEIPEPWDNYRYESFLESFKTALMLKSWISEKDEDWMMDRFNVTPGGIRAKVESCDWLLYACEEMCRLKDWEEEMKTASKLRTRVQHGIEEDLVRLVRFKGVGRVRARRLFDYGVEDVSDIREIGFTRLKKMVGDRTARRLKEEVGEENLFDKENVLDYFKEGN